jgi:hypothetical protein
MSSSKHFFREAAAPVAERSQRSSRGAFDSAQAQPLTLVLRVDRSQLRRHSSHRRGVRAVGLSIKNRRTRLRRLSGAEAKGAGLKSAERSRRWLSVAEARGASAVPSTTLRHRRGSWFFGLTGLNCDGILRIEEA